MTSGPWPSNQEGFTGKVAIVTGGVSGIGLATVTRLLHLGATVVATDIAPRPDGFPKSENARYVRHDVTDRASWKNAVDRVVDEFGRIDILVNCAGILREGTLESTTLKEWRQVMAVNVEGTFCGVQAVIPHMPASGGAIVNLASVSGSRADAKLVAYTTSKSAVVNLTREIALDCARRGTNIRCNSVSPGVVDTTMIENFFDASVDVTLPEWLDTQPLRRSIAPAEIADIIVFLAGSDSTFVTGADFPIDCGATA
ncbi:short-chain dehydrogenase [Mesorhizobium sp. 113-3-9]|nr:short-chain dehydrogenase [Mesorhizobium sp. 113-3-9]